MALFKGISVSAASVIGSGLHLAGRIRVEFVQKRPGTLAAHIRKLDAANHLGRCDGIYRDPSWDYAVRSAENIPGPFSPFRYNLGGFVRRHRICDI